MYTLVGVHPTTVCQNTKPSNKLRPFPPFTAPSSVCTISVKQTETRKKTQRTWKSRIAPLNRNSNLQIKTIMGVFHKSITAPPNRNPNTSRQSLTKLKKSKPEIKTLIPNPKSKSMKLGGRKVSNLQPCPLKLSAFETTSSSPSDNLVRLLLRSYTCSSFVGFSVLQSCWSSSKKRYGKSKIRLSDWGKVETDITGLLFHGDNLR